MPDINKLGLNLGWRGDLAPIHNAALSSILRSKGLGATLAESAPHLVGNLPPKTTILHDAAKSVLGGEFLRPQNQPRGTCTSRGAKRAIDLTQCIAIAGGAPQQFKYSSHAVLYGAGREHAGMLGGNPNNENDDGCTGAAVAWAAMNVGNMANDEDADDDNSDDLACLWGARGVPADRKAQAGQRRIRAVTAAHSVPDVIDAIVNGYAVTVASTVGFAGIRSQHAFGRDSEGRAHRGGSWPHQMVFTGFRDDKGWLLVDQSWGPECPDGPLGTIEIPSYSFWVEAEDAALMIREQDTWIYGGFDGWVADRMHWFI